MADTDDEFASSYTSLRVVGRRVVESPDSRGSHPGVSCVTRRAESFAERPIGSCVAFGVAATVRVGVLPLMLPRACRLAHCVLLAASLPATSLAAQTAWRDPSPHREALLAANGISLQYLDWGGTGPAMVFLTGLGTTPHLFDRIAPQFTDRYRVLGLTRRGLGKSQRTPSGYDTGTLTEDLRGFLDAMGITRATLVGWSLAGTEMTRLAENYPDRVERLVYLEAAYDWTPFPALWKQDPVPSAPTDADLASFETSKRWFQRTQGMWSDAVEADGRAINLQPDGRMTMDVMPIEIMRQLIAGMVFARPRFADVRAPVLALYAVPTTHPAVHPGTPDSLRRKGEAYWRDVFLPAQRKQIDAFKAARPDARVVEIVDGRHLCFIRPADEALVLREMRAFLGIEDR